MKKSELESGMLAETRNGNRYLLFKNKAGQLSGKSIKHENKAYGWVGWFLDSGLRSDLEFELCEYSIDKIWWGSDASDMLEARDKDLIWERNHKVKEYTIEQLQEKLGEEFKIVKNK
jgi:hypothetical protein